METLNGTSPSENLKQQGHPHAEKKRLNRAPSPARPFLKDLHGRASSAKPPPVPPKAPSLSGKPQQPGAPPQSAGLLATQSRLSRRSGSQGAKAAAGTGGRAGSAKAALWSKKAARAQEQGSGKAGARQGGGQPGHQPGKGRKGKRGGAPQQGGSLASAGGPWLGSGHAAEAAPARLSHTDSSSDLSDCPSEPLSDEQRPAQAASSDAESGTGSSDREQPPAPGRAGTPVPGSSPALGAQPSPESPAGQGAAQPAPPCSPQPASPAPGGEEPSWRQAAENMRLDSKAPAPCHPPAAEEELLREIEELRSENDYLKYAMQKPFLNKVLVLQRGKHVLNWTRSGPDLQFSYASLLQLRIWPLECPPTACKVKSVCKSLQDEDLAA